MLIDTHAHLNFKIFKEDADEVVLRSLENSTWMINVGSQYLSSKKAVEISGKHQKGVYASVGLHPIHARDGFDYQTYVQLARSPKTVAVGEIGLDYKKEYVFFRKKQKEIFLEQLKLAKDLNLPVIFHCRMAHDDLTEILKKQKMAGNENLKGVVHCFTGNRKQAEKYLAMGFYLGFNGIIFKINLDDIIKKTPLESILIETDCPYLNPPQIKGRNEPVHVKIVAERIAEIKNLSFDKIAEITTENAKKLFKI